MSGAQGAGLPGAERQQEIAVIGMSGRFPGCSRSGGLAAFWHNLREGIESISFFSEEEIAASGEDPALFRQPHYVPANGVIDDIELFDAAFFDVSPREAAVMDPQHRLFLEAAWEALENAGYDPARFAGPIGVFAGASLNRYALYQLSSGFSRTDHRWPADAFQVGIGNEKDHLPTRVSYKLDLKGPSVNVQTACSTSLVAVHLACQSLLVGECDLALAGGVSLAAPARTGYLHYEGSVSSPDGRCRAFDARAQGTAVGAGLGVVVLKRLPEALADGDLTRAVIKGSAINNDGAAKVGYAAPGVAGQAAVIAEALAVAGVAAETVGYVEAHGTGTPLGDPVEIAALTEAFRHGASGSGAKSSCAVGSVKTNIGHLDTAAGVAGLIKTVLALEHGEIPPSLHFTEPNPEIDFAASPFYVNTRLRPWPRRGAPRRAGVSSFGIGGTNAHMVLEEAPKRRAAAASLPWYLLPLSARTATALEAVTARLAAYLGEHPDLSPADVAYTLQVGRSELEHRRMLVCGDLQDAVECLAGRDRERLRTAAGKPRPRPVAFLFPGAGAQYPGMGRELYAALPAFRRDVDRCAELFRPHLGFDLRTVLHPTAAEPPLDRPSSALPALFATEYALARLWMAWGVMPEVMIGHSLGEYVAACLAGVMSLEDAVALVALRGQLFERLPDGAVASLPLAEAEARALVKASAGELSLAAVNGPAQSVISGPRRAVAAAAAALAERGLEARPLAIEFAAHSSLVEPILGDFADAVAALRLEAPRIPYVSNVSGDWITARQATDPAYWVRHLRQTVRFADGLEKISERGEHLLLEAGPGRALTNLARRQVPDALAFTSLPAADEGPSELAAMLTTLGRLWLTGLAVDWPGYYDGERRTRVELPTYPFERRRYWIEPTAAAGALAAGVSESAAKKSDLADWFYIPSWRPAPVTAPAPAALADDRNWLVFATDHSLSSALVERLRHAGRTVTQALSGARFGRLDGETWALDPGAAEDYRNLFEALRAGGETPSRIVHLWSIDRKPPYEEPGEKFEKALDSGFYSLLHLVRALESVDFTDPLRLVVVSDRMQDVGADETLQPEIATLLAPCRVIPQEYPHVTCRSVDVAVPETGSWREGRLADQLARELVLDPGDTTVAYRGLQRWVRDVEPVRLEGSADPAIRFRRRGVYLITGGLGRIGLALAESLARTCEARLILTGRTALPPREEWGEWLASDGKGDAVSWKIRGLRALEDLGAQFLAVPADAGDREQMRRVVGEAEERFGRISGVLHAAGVTAGEAFVTLHETGRAHAEGHFRPKVQGLLVLEEVFREREPEFFLLFSSISSLLGGVGFACYAAANQFMDAFAREKSRTSAVPWISVNWDGWRFDGEEGDGGARTFGAELAELAMTAAEGEEAIRRILAADCGAQVVVSTCDLRRRISRWVELEEPRTPAEERRVEPPSHEGRPGHLDTPYVAPGSELERLVADIWEEVLGIAGIGVHDNFFELGGDSLLATQVLTRLRRRRLELSLPRFFKATTVAELARAVASAADPATAVASAPEIGDFEEGSL